MVSGADAGVGPVGHEGGPVTGAGRRASGRPSRRGRWTRVAALVGVVALASFEVPGPDSPTTAGPGVPPLPRTGVELGWLMRGAALLLSVGGFLLILRRRIDGRPTDGADPGEGL